VSLELAARAALAELKLKPKLGLGRTPGLGRALQRLGGDHLVGISRRQVQQITEINVRRAALAARAAARVDRFHAHPRLPRD